MDSIIKVADKSFDHLVGNFKKIPFPFNIKKKARDQIARLAQKSSKNLDRSTNDGFHEYIVLESPLQFSLLPFLGKTKTELVFQNLEILEDWTKTNENWSLSVLVWSWTSLD